MTILLADDEKLARYTLKSMLKEIGIPASSVHVACDGQEMIDKVASIRPDLALVDIKMPRLDGLEAIRRGRVLSPHTRWVILTSYSMFEYAKQAVALGASAYLLKPVSPHDLSQTVHQVTQTSRGSYQHLNDEFEAHLNALLHGTTTAEYAALEFLHDAVLWGSLLVFDSNLKKQDLILQEQQACKLIRRKVAAAVDQSTRIGLCRLAVGPLVLIGAWFRGHGEQESSAAIRDLFRKSPIYLNSTLPHSVCCTIIVGDRCDRYEEFEEHLCLLRELAALRVLIGVGGAIPWISLRDRQGFLPENELCRNLVLLPEVVREGTYLDFLKLVDAIVTQWMIIPDSRRLEISDPVLRFLEVSLDFSPQASMRGDAWHKRLREHGKRLFENTNDGKPEDVFAQVVDFIDKNYMNDIGVAQIASYLDITPNYLSQRFHEKNGIPFVRYLTRLRITKAKQLLSDPSQQIQQIAREVGYTSARHFSALFKLHEGQTPSDYRNARLRDTGSRES
jgi:two-component system response regulator YesN